MNYEKKIVECDKKIKDFTEIIKPTIRNWLEQDPTHYCALLWALKFFKGKELIGFFERANKMLPDNANYQNMLGSIYFNSGDSEKSIEPYKI